MLTTTVEHKSIVEQLLATERRRLVHFCIRWTGDREAAEDLAQETLIIAWQQQQRLRKPEAPTHWLTGIARNLCRHWRRDMGREAAHSVAYQPLDPDEGSAQNSRPLAAFDLAVELAQNELAHLLDYALTQLPALTRTVLIERFIHDRPQAEVAQRLGVSEGAVEARVQRGKVSLRRILTTDLHEEAAAYGLASHASQGWQETKLWCPACGERRLRGYFSAGEPRTFTLRCVCGLNSCLAGIPTLFDGLYGFRAAATRVARWQHSLYEQGVQTGQVTCPHCGASCAFRVQSNAGATAHDAPTDAGYWINCTACKTWQRQADLGGIAMHFPIVQQFWQKHPRMISLPIRTVEVEGAAALVTGFADRMGSAQIELVFQRSTLAPISGTEVV